MVLPGAMADLSLILELEAPDDAETIQHLNERVFGPGRFARLKTKLHVMNGSSSQSQFIPDSRSDGLLALRDQTHPRS